MRASARAQLVGHEAFHGPRERRVGARTIGFSVNVREPHRIAKSVSLRTTESGNVLGLWSVLADVRCPVVVERCVLHADAQSRLDHFGEARGHPYDRKRPKAVPPEQVADAVIKAVTGDKHEQYVPSTFRGAVVARHSLPPLFRWGSKRSFTKELAEDRRAR